MWNLDALRSRAGIPGRRTDADPVTRPGRHVLRTVLDARAVGLDVIVLDDAVRAVDVESGDGARAAGRMRAAGAIFAFTRTALAEG